MEPREKIDEHAHEDMEMLWEETKGGDEENTKHKVSI